MDGGLEFHQGGNCPVDHPGKGGWESRFKGLTGTLDLEKRAQAKRKDWQEH